MTAEIKQEPLAPPTAAPRRTSDRGAVSTGRGLVRPRLAALVVVCVLVLVFGATAEPSVRYALVLSVVYAIAILGNNAVLALLGEMNLSAGAAMALSAYSFCYLANNGMPTVPALVLALLITTVVSAVIAIPTTRLQGIFTALVTFALAYAMPTLAIYLSDYTGGDAGTPAPFDFAPLGLALTGGSIAMLASALVVFGLLGALTLHLFNGRAGRAALMVGEAELAGTVAGLNQRLVKVAVWTWAGLLGGVAGVLYALTTGFLGPTSFHFMLGVWILVGGVVAGPRSVWGALLGGLFVGVLPFELQTFVPATATNIFFGAILLLALFAGGRGLSELVERGALRFWVSRRKEALR